MPNPTFIPTPDKLALWEWKKVQPNMGSPVWFLTIGTIRFASVKQGIGYRNADGTTTAGKWSYMVGPLMAYNQPAMPLQMGRGEVESEFMAMQRCEELVQALLAAAGLSQTAPAGVSRHA